MASLSITDDQLEEIGLMADTCDNLVGATNLPLPPAVHVEQLRKGLEQMSARLKQIVVAIGGEDPWKDYA